MEYTPSRKPNNVYSLDVLGYLIVANNQVHSFQTDALYDYLERIHTDISESHIGSIIDGTNDSDFYKSSLFALEKEDDPLKKDIIYMLNLLSLLDHSIEACEETIINDVVARSKLPKEDVDSIKSSAEKDSLKFREENNIVFKRAHSKKENKSWFQKVIEFVRNLFKKLFKGEGNQDELEKERYIKSIEKCSIEASDDFSSLNPIYENIIGLGTQVLNEIEIYKNEMSLDTDYSSEIVKAITAYAEILKLNVIKQTKIAQSSNEQKKRTVSDFTISLLGRTKAGKSTLHTILTNQNPDKIGKGKQRTTRYNCVYQWNLLRLIDTPGIGSAEAAGRSDDEIAESVLGESDVICFVVVDDSILRDVLEFIEKIAKLNKPIIVLLNHKENIKPEVKYNRFLAKPKDWLNTKGESNLDGHINRIRKYAEEKGFDSLIKVYPVFLLPALMSSQEKYSKDSELLWESSNIEPFIDQLENWIVKYGPIKRSQTILDEAIQMLNKSLEEITKAETVIEKEKNKINEQRKSKIEDLKNIQNKVSKNISNILDNKFNELATQHSLLFAEEEIAKNHKNISSDSWTQYLQKINFVDELKDLINQEVQRYSEKAKDVIYELFEDLSLSIKTNYDMLDIKIPIIIDLRMMAFIAGAILDVAGIVITIVEVVSGVANPIGWAFAVAGIAVGLIKGKFKSKAEKKQKQINKIYESIKGNIEDNKDSIIEQIIDKVEMSLNESTDKIDHIFLDLENGLEKTMSLSNELKNEYIYQINKLNKLYAFKLSQFIINESKPDRTIELGDVKNVDRSDAQRIIIKLSTRINTINNYALEGVIAEKITIEGDY